ncbi:hypothetical protein IV38_GL001450 [Lactobacillus selangorensis]|uniref:Uncharacterized protein n=1 Tax=Lactobacillus selangorensis TaxID=81857 RepID=A0A0R2FIG8_9LACO|nr:PTS glucitol/sorbitol transporter subunit IIA [Lactobacillus selangorensis]KRN28449.1 hypothetical protein IV38_GL001450 [Lactobacillus selangorensis]KRN31950.1 hypothetical protein IV40_GL001237 [Lactobacillus selangorensis]
MTEITSRVTAVGPQAFSGEAPLIILFDNSATAALKEVAVIQQFDGDSEKNVQLQVGDQLTLKGQVYPIVWMGSLVNANLESIGHATLVFQAAPIESDQALQNGIYLGAGPLPTLQVDDKITYTHLD